MDGDDSRIIMDRVIPFIEANKDQPFLATVWFHAPHEPVVAGEEYRKPYAGLPEQQQNLYGCITAMDEQIGRLREKLRELKLEKDTIVFFCSDNGPADSLAKKGIASAGPFKGHKHKMYEGGTLVPACAEWPGVIAEGTTTSVRCATVDFFPTIAKLVGAKKPKKDKRPIDGIDLMPVIAGKATQRSKELFFGYRRLHTGVDGKAIIDGDWKLMREAKKNGRLRLYNLSKDPYEKNDLAAENSDLVARLTEQLTKLEESCQLSRDGAKQKKKMRVLQTLLVVLVLGALSPFAYGGGPAEAADSPPNVLLIMIDDLNDWVGAAGGHPQAKTPNLDRLISQGVFFGNAHCAAPVCGASRHSLMSGLRPSTTGWYTGGAKTKESYERVLGETIPMPTHFKRNGYKTMAAGKVFHKGTSDAKDYEFWDETRPRYKWPKSFIERGHGYKGRHFYPFPRDGGGIYQLHQEGVSGQSLCWGSLEEDDIPDEGMPDEQIAQWAVDRLKQKQDKPFFMAVGFLRPHVPFTAPKKYFDLYPLDKVQMPTVPSDEMKDVPLFAKAMAYGTLDGGDHQNVLDAGPDYWREMVRAYLACVSFVDDQAGKVLKALDDGPNGDNTIVVFLSDHGQHLGEKMSWRKQDLWEEATRVPLSIRFPAAHEATQYYKGEINERASSLLKGPV